MVPADSRRIPRVPRYSGYHYAQSRFAYRALTVCGGPFQGPSARDHDTITWSYYPDAALRQRRFGLFPVRSPLLGESLLFSLPGGTKMFQFPPLASLRGRDTAEAVGCPIRKSAGQGLFAPNRGLSQLITSFIASVSQGIRLAPFSTFFESSMQLLARKTVAHTFSCWFTTVSLVSICQRSFPLKQRMVENIGFEPMTPCLQGRCSSQLS